MAWPSSLACACSCARADCRGKRKSRRCSCATGRGRISLAGCAGGTKFRQECLLLLLRLLRLRCARGGESLRRRSGAGLSQISRACGRRVGRRCGLFASHLNHHLAHDRAVDPISAWRLLPAWQTRGLSQGGRAMQRWSRSSLIGHRPPPAPAAAHCPHHGHRQSGAYRGSLAAPNLTASAVRPMQDYCLEFQRTSWADKTREARGGL